MTLQSSLATGTRRPLVNRLLLVGKARPLLSCSFPQATPAYMPTGHIDLDNADQDFDQSTGRDDYWDFEHPANTRP